MTTWFDDVSRQVRSFLDSLWQEAKGEGLLPMLRPVAPFNEPAFLAPVVTVAGLVSLMLLSGTAVAALGTMLAAMLTIYLLLVQVFGVSLEINPMAFGR